MKEIVAIIGRPNVGKSSLYNRLAEKRLAIVHDMPGVTRDRNYTTAKWYDHEYILIDTGGIDYTDDQEIFKEMMIQAELAIAEATKIIFLMDGLQGLTASDEELVDYFRKTNDKQVYYVVNKVDHADREGIQLADFYALGVDEIYPVSAQTKFGITEMMDAVFDDVEPLEIVENDYRARIAVVGRPNVGKSSFINKILGTDRLIVHNESGTTRDAIDTEISYYGHKYLFIDTAGVRKKARIKYALERFMVVKAFISMDRADVVILIIDAKVGLTDQDKRLIKLCTEKGKPMVILMNKWDLIEKDNTTHKETLADIRYEIHEIKDIPIIFTSALTGQRVYKVFQEIDRLMEATNFRIGTGELNRFMQEVINGHPHPMVKSKKVIIKYMSQVSSNPPTFMLSCNRPELVKKSYTRFITNQLRKRYPLHSVPIKIFFRSTQRERPF